MKKLFSILFFGFFTFVLAAQESVETEKSTSTQPIAISESLTDSEKSISNLAGEWFVFVLNRGTKNLLADYNYLIDAKGNWSIRHHGKNTPESLGIVAFLDGKLTFIPNDKQPEKKQERRGIVATSIESNKIVLNNEIQKNISLCFERLPQEKIFPIAALPGKWQFHQIQLVDGESKTAPFEAIFNSDGTYQVRDKATGKINLETSGSYTVKEGKLLVKNYCSDPNNMWHNAVFFHDNGKLVLNRLSGYVYGEKK